MRVAAKVLLRCLRVVYRRGTLFVFQSSRSRFSAANHVTDLEMLCRIDRLPRLSTRSVSSHTTWRPCIDISRHDELRSLRG